MSNYLTPWFGFASKIPLITARKGSTRKTLAGFVPRSYAPLCVFHFACKPCAYFLTALTPSLSAMSNASCRLMSSATASSPRIASLRMRWSSFATAEVNTFVPSHAYDPKSIRAKIDSFKSSCFDDAEISTGYRCGRRHAYPVKCAQRANHNRSIWVPSPLINRRTT